MATNTYIALNKVTASTSVSFMEFTNISGSYTDLMLIFNGTASGAANLNVQFNGDTGNNYSFTAIWGTGSVTGSNRQSNTSYIRSGYITTAQTGTTLYFQNYSNTTTYKPALMQDYPGGGDVEAASSIWRNTAAITSIKFYPSAGTFASGSTISLYGIKSQVTGTAKATGGTITYDSFGNVIHTFTSSGTFTPSQSLSVDYLVVAGGGAGGGRQEWGGGGGAGGLRSTVTATGGGGSLESALSLNMGTSYTVTIGGGGAGKTTAGAGNNGSNSVFSSITSTGGGGGGGVNAARNGIESASTGGSGGGGENNAVYFGGSSAGAAGTANQGYAGGNGWNTNPVYNYSRAGGGGGAGAVGVNGEQGGSSSSPSSPAGNGGNGVAVSITGSSVTYAGGGGGGSYFSTALATGGTGGGGSAGNSSTNGTAGTANTGGGGGGSGNTTTGAGGSGIVIIRYAG